jgi:uncharacterized caspase-like protein
MIKPIGTLLCFSAISLISGGFAFADPRVALVIGNAGYKSFAPAPFAASDANAISETLRGAGYDVTDVRDLGQADVGKTIRDFLDKIASGGAQTDAFFYFSGYGAQVDSENYLIPVDATIRAHTDVANESFRLNEFLGELAQIQANTKIVVVDGSREHNIPNLAKGLAITEVPSGTLVAFAAAPGAPSIEGAGPNSLYGAALASQMRNPSLEINDVFKTARFNVSKITSSQQVPWSASSLAVQFHLFEPATQAEVDKQTQTASVRPSNRIRSKQELAALAVDDAYQAIMELDTLKAYQWFVELYPKDPRSAEIWPLINKRREALLWRRAATGNTKGAYWNYIKRYPNGPYIYEARERLVLIGAPIDPPFDYVPAPEPLLLGYVDEAIGVPEIYYPGVPVLPVFDPAPPMMVDSPVALLASILPAIIAPAAIATVPFMNRSGPRLAPPVAPAFANLRTQPQNLVRPPLRNTGVIKPGVNLPSSRIGGLPPRNTGVIQPPQRNSGLSLPPRNTGVNMPPSASGPSVGAGAPNSGGLPPVPNRGGQPTVGHSPMPSPAPSGGPIAQRQDHASGPSSPVVQRRTGPYERQAGGRTRPTREHVASRRSPSGPVLRRGHSRPSMHRAAPRHRPAIHRAAAQRSRPVMHRPRAISRPQVRVSRPARPSFRAFRAPRMSFGGRGRRR